MKVTLCDAYRLQTNYRHQPGIRSKESDVEHKDLEDPGQSETVLRYLPQEKRCWHLPELAFLSFEALPGETLAKLHS